MITESEISSALSKLAANHIAELADTVQWYLAVSAATGLPAPAIVARLQAEIAAYEKANNGNGNDKEK